MSRTLSVIVCGTLLAAGAGAASTYATHSQPASPVDPHAGHVAAVAVSPLAARVREVTAMYRDVNVAIAAGYSQFGGCVSGPEAGAMGVHFVKGELVDGTLDANEPEALIYEMKDGAARLVGVEYITPVAAWDAAHEGPPVLEGQHLQLVGTPNRYRLPALYELHVWAWRDNPNGMFVDWNPRVSCEGAE
jgi:hypothetical protein